MIADDLALKLSIHQHCINLIEEKIITIQKEYRLYQDSAANETKSSAGDKHDTGKAMMQMEQEKLGIQFKELVNSKKILGSINPSTRYNKIQFGSFIKTETSWFYISISLGKISIENKEIFILSSQTPLSKLMLNKSVGDSFSFNGTHYKVTDVC
jgi:hypothetical protein